MLTLLLVAATHSVAVEMILLHYMNDHRKLDAAWGNTWKSRSLPPLPLLQAAFPCQWQHSHWHLLSPSLSPSLSPLLWLMRPALFIVEPIVNKWMTYRLNEWMMSKFIAALCQLFSVCVGLARAAPPPSTPWLVLACFVCVLSVWHCVFFWQSFNYLPWLLVSAHGT